MIVLLASMAFASEPALDTPSSTDDEVSIESTLSILDEGRVLVVSVGAAAERVQYQLVLNAEELAWGEATLNPAGIAPIVPETELLPGMHLLVTPVDAEGFAVGPTADHDIQGAFGRGTRSTVSQNGGRTELL